MKQEELMKLLIKELFKMDTLHQEYQDQDTQFVIDSQKNGNTLTINVTVLDNKDKKEFESWLQHVDNDIFSEVLDELGETLNLEKAYNGPNYKEVIAKVKNKTRDVAARRIKELQALL